MKRGTGAQAMYWPVTLDDCVDRYNKAVTVEKRNAIYEEHLNRPIAKLVENVFNTFKFSYFEVGPLDTQKECISHIVANLHQYDPSKGKSYSYFSIVAKNFLIALNNSNFKKWNKQNSVSMCFNDGDEENVDLDTLMAESIIENDREKEQVNSTKEFLPFLADYLEQRYDKQFTGLTRFKQVPIAQAVIELLRTESDLDNSCFKKHIFAKIRSRVNASTNTITATLKKLYPLYIHAQAWWKEDSHIIFRRKIERPKRKYEEADPKRKAYSHAYYLNVIIPKEKARRTIHV